MAKYENNEFLFDNDLNTIYNAHAGNGVLSGLEVTFDVDMDIDISAGSCLINGSVVNYAGGSLTVDNGDATHPRKDIVVIDDLGAVSVVKGTPQTKLPSANDGKKTYQPLPPTIPDDSILLCEIWVDTGVTELENEDLKDLRLIITETGFADPMTTRGDVIIRDASNDTARLGVGANGQVLKSDGTDISWQNDVGFADPMTTRGDIIIRNSGNSTARLGVGANGQVLKSDGTDISWQNESGGGGASAPIVLNIPGELYTGQMIAYPIQDSYNGLDIKEVRIGCLGLPTGQAIKVDVRKNGTATTNSIFTSDVPIEIGTGQTATNGLYQTGCDTSGATVGTPGTTIDGAQDTVSADDVLFVYVTQVGSTVTGADLIITMNLG